MEKTFNKLALARLQDWAQKNTTARDVIVLEARIPENGSGGPGSPRRTACLTIERLSGFEDTI